jgi:hypothetical protein
VPVRSIIAAFAVLLALSCDGWAASPKARIAGPHLAVPGDRIELDASESTGDNLIYRWSIFPTRPGREQLTVTDDRTKCLVASYPGKYQVRLIVADKKLDEIDETTWDLTVEGSVECPEPAPVPVPEPVLPRPVPPVSPLPPAPQPVLPKPVVPTPPAPTPVVPVPSPVVPTPTPEPVTPAPDPANLPKGRFDAARQVYTAVRGINSANKKAELQDLIAKLEATHKDIKAGQVSPQQVVDRVGGELKLLPGGWGPLRSLAVLAIRALNAMGLLNDLGNWGDLIFEIILGLKAAEAQL